MAEDYKPVNISIDGVIDMLIANGKLKCDYCYNIHNGKSDTLHLNRLDLQNSKITNAFGKG